MLRTRQRSTAIDPTDERTRAVDTLLDILDRAPSGHAFVRNTLRTIISSWGVENAALVTTDSDGERLVLTADGQPPRGRLRELVDAFDGVGLVTDPQIDQDAPRVWAVRHVAEVALQLDREGWQPELDVPSGLLNRAGFRRQVLLARSRHEHGEHPFSLVVLDVDEVGFLDDDVRASVVARTGAALTETLRRIDSAARVDDHRFTIVLEGADRSDARHFFSRLRDRISSDPILTTVSYRIGVASCPEDTLDTTHVLRSASIRLDEGEVEMRALPGRRLDLVATVELGTATEVPPQRRDAELPGTGHVTDVDATVDAVEDQTERPTIRQLRQARGFDSRGQRRDEQPTAAPEPRPAATGDRAHDVVERTPPPVVPDHVAASADNARLLEDDPAPEFPRLTDVPTPPPPSTPPVQVTDRPSTRDEVSPSPGRQPEPEPKPHTRVERPVAKPEPSKPKPPLAVRAFSWRRGRD